MPASLNASFAFLVGLQPQLCGLWRIFVAPFLFNRLICLHISLCCDSVSFDFIKPATTVARFIQHSCLFYVVLTLSTNNREFKQSSRLSNGLVLEKHMP